MNPVLVLFCRVLVSFKKNVSFQSEVASVLLCGQDRRLQTMEHRHSQLSRAISDLKACVMPFRSSYTAQPTLKNEPRSSVEALGRASDLYDFSETVFPKPKSGCGEDSRNAFCSFSAVCKSYELSLRLCSRHVEYFHFTHSNTCKNRTPRSTFDPRICT